MPITCKDNERVIFSFRLNSEDWDDLAEDNRQTKHLAMTCCDSKAVLKRSRFGTQFFAHARKGECATATESPEHLLAKEIIAKAIEAAGWEAHVEFSHPERDWVADVIAVNGDASIVFEVQLASQTIPEILQRHERYERDGMACVWLLGSATFRIKSLGVLFNPLFYLEECMTSEQVTSFCVYQGYGENRVPIEQVVSNVLAGHQNIEGKGIQALIRHAKGKPLTSKEENAYIKAAISESAQKQGWKIKIDHRYEAWRPRTFDRHSGIQVQDGVWNIDVYATRESRRVAFHIIRKPNWDLIEKYVSHYIRYPQTVHFFLLLNPQWKDYYKFDRILSHVMVLRKPRRFDVVEWLFGDNLEYSDSLADKLSRILGS